MKRLLRSLTLSSLRGQQQGPGIQPPCARPATHVELPKQAGKEELVGGLAIQVIDPSILHVDAQRP
jgi:hypothetical protein